MFRRLIFFVSVSILAVNFTACLKPRVVDVGPGPDVIGGDTIRRGAIFINEVNNRWGTANLSNELSPQLARRFNPAIGDDWKDGRVKWFELYNNTDRAINLGDTTRGFWYISDNRQLKTACQIRVPVTIPSRGYVLVYSSDTNYSAGNQIHANFNAGRNNSASRDTLGIYYQVRRNAPLITVDSMTWADAARTETWSRVPDGGNLITKTAPSPGASNR